MSDVVPPVEEEKDVLAEVQERLRRAVAAASPRPTPTEDEPKPPRQLALAAYVACHTVAGVCVWQGVNLYTGGSAVWGVVLIMAAVLEMPLALVDRPIWTLTLGTLACRLLDYVILGLLLYYGFVDLQAGRTQRALTLLELTVFLPLIEILAVMLALGAAVPLLVRRPLKGASGGAPEPTLKQKAGVADLYAWDDLYALDGTAGLCALVIRVLRAAPEGVSSKVAPKVAPDNV